MVRNAKFYNVYFITRILAKNMKTKKLKTTVLLIIYQLNYFIFPKLFRKTHSYPIVSNIPEHKAPSDFCLYRGMMAPETLLDCNEDSIMLFLCQCLMGSRSWPLVHTRPSVICLLPPSPMRFS